MKYEKIGREIGQLVDKKNNEYGSSFEKIDKILEIIYPNGINQKQYKNMGLIVRILDKIIRIANGNKGDEDAFNDLAGYGILGSHNKGIISYRDRTPNVP